MSTLAISLLEALMAKSLTIPFAALLPINLTLPKRTLNVRYRESAMALTG